MEGDKLSEKYYRSKTSFTLLLACFKVCWVLTVHILKRHHFNWILKPQHETILWTLHFPIEIIYSTIGWYLHLHNSMIEHFILWILEQIMEVTVPFFVLTVNRICLYQSNTNCNFTPCRWFNSNCIIQVSIDIVSYLCLYHSNPIF